MLRTFLVTVTHHDLNGGKGVTREHRVYMPDKEYDKSGSRYRNERWVEKSLEKKIGPKYEDYNASNNREHPNSYSFSCSDVFVPVV